MEAKVHQWLLLWGRDNDHTGALLSQRLTPLHGLCQGCTGACYVIKLAQRLWTCACRQRYTKDNSQLWFGNLLGDIGCKIVVSLERVARGLSICTTSLLTVVQAITISPRASRWGRLQPRSAWHLLPLFLFCWILNSLISMNLLFYIKNISSMNTSEFSENGNYCYFLPENWIIGRIFTGLMVLRDAVFQGAMGGASGHMVFVLHKHHQQVLHLQTSKLLHRTPPEVKAAKSVLLLMLCFLFFYWADCFVSLCLFSSLLENSASVSAQEFLTLSYAIVSSFLLIHRDGYLVESCHAHEYCHTAKTKEDVGRSYSVWHYNKKKEHDESRCLLGLHGGELHCGLGIVGNVLVLVNYMGLFRSTMKSIHLVLIHLAFTNMMTLLTRGMPRTVSSLGLRSLIDDMACKVVVYLSRVARGLSICTTSLLTVVQAITISPRASRWGRLQPRSAWHLLPLLLFFWILNSVISMNLPFYIKHIRSMNTSEVTRSDNFCYFQSQNWTIGWIFIVLMVLRDAVFQGAMGGASGYMVFLLHKHHQQVLHLQTSKLLHRTPPEVKAAKSVLLLMLCFLFFYWTNCFLSLYVTFSVENNFIEGSAVEFVDLGYAVLSPLVLMHRDGHLAECRHVSVSMIFQ
ncbi:hypothetical protein GHT09_009390 [Marmota monax]|uniref:G-protein coupled receptors family 1 profile domain-containing protein n=1 Tax=Marmota monax TaxID=9995 RepID=A0A834QJP2_MARMO|nr:hypothetical protein GHT09_009390 [Marmota monax]